MLRKSFLLLVVCLSGLALAELYSFNQCEADVQNILNGTLTIGDISNETIGRYIYQGHVTGLKHGFPRSQYLAITYEGNANPASGSKPIKSTADRRQDVSQFAATKSSSTPPRQHST
jgi:hypothetical protein